MADITAGLEDLYRDFDWDSFNDLRIDDATVEADLAAVAEHRLQAAFNAAEEHHLRSAPEGATISTRNGRGKAAYVVFNGRKNGVYRTWPATHYQVVNFPGAAFMGYKTVEDAENAWQHACASGVVRPPADFNTGGALLRPGPVPATAPSSHSYGATDFQPSLPSASLTSISSPSMSASATQPLISASTPAALTPNPSISASGSPFAMPASLPGYWSPVAEVETTAINTNLELEDVTAGTPRNSTGGLAASFTARGGYQRLATPLSTAASLPLRSDRRASRGSGMPAAAPSFPQPRLPTGGLDDEDTWWVVIEGLRPGAYQGRRAAASAAGNGLLPMVVKKSTTYVQAFAAFGQASMEGLVLAHPLCRPA